MLLSVIPEQLNFIFCYGFNLLSTNFTKWLNTLKQFVGKLPTYSLSVFYHFAGMAFKGLMYALSRIPLVHCVV